MPLEGLEEEGLPKNPDIHLAQLKFLLTVEEGVDREAVWGELIAAIKESGEYGDTSSFWSVCGN